MILGQSYEHATSESARSTGVYRGILPGKIFKIYFELEQERQSEGEV